MSINQQLSQLYTNWKDENTGHFVSGGVVDEARYAQCETKVLYLLKEVNDPDQESDWSLVDFIRSQIQTSTFYRSTGILGIWNFGLQHGLPSHQSIIAEQKKNMADGLSSIAITNLKKSGGGGSSNMDEILLQAEYAKELWMEEIELIHPDIGVCCGTFSVVKSVVGFQTEVCDSGALYGDALGTRFVEFVHPMYRISPKIMYAHFKETMQSCRSTT
ncbi:hypothetical protein [Sporosarcina ureae]|uniref:Uncharacterized protein n=1 Tax=Sporosarcina ureae TaxID=1571 RepID=A0ABN4YX01_SPOUR|nr:hypothetical protein [Sporosarcina ureae]ARF14911.1 hypothetical protein SporoS204_12560 [Sporosarcina ureae]